MRLFKVYVLGAILAFSAMFTGCKADIDIRTPNVPLVQQVISEETGYFYVNDPIEKSGYKKIVYAEFAWLLELNASLSRPQATVVLPA